MKRTLAIAMTIGILTTLANSPARAQGSASLAGVVRDTSGAVVPGATLTVLDIRTGVSRSVVTDGDGAFRVLGLATGEDVQVAVELAGFQIERRRLQSLTAGERRVIDVTITPASVSAEVVVRPDIPIARTTTPELGGTLSQEQVESVPVNGRDLVSLAYLVPGAAPSRGFYNLAPRLTINGSSSLVTNYSVDGFDNTDLFLGGPKVPVTVGSTQNLAVLVNSYSAEYGRTGNGVFAVTTRSGANRVTGDAFYAVRPGSALDSPNHFAPRDEAGNVIADSFQRHQAGGSIGGPLVRDRTFYFGNIEVARERQDAILTSPLSVGLAPTSFDNQQGMAKLHHRWNDRQTSVFRYLGGAYTHDGDVGFVGGLTLPSAGLQVNYRTQFAAFTHRSVTAHDGLNELGVQVGQLRADWRSLDPGPRVVVTDGGATQAVIGSVSDTFFWTERDLQVREVFTAPLKRHTLRVGGDLLRGDFDIRSGPGARGEYIVDLEGRSVTPSGPYLTVSDLPADTKVLSYSQSFVNAEVRRAQTLASLFVEDSWRATSDFTASFGMRWDYDSVTNTPAGHPDLDNVAPRLGFTWTPGGSSRRLVRGGYGLFYERIPFAVYSDTMFNAPTNGAIGITFAPGTPFPPPPFPTQLPRNAVDSVPLDQLPPRNVQVFDPDLKSPRNEQLSVGYVLALTSDMAVSVDYVFNRGFNLIRRIDTNAPASVPAGIDRPVAAADSTRPVVPVAGGYRLIEQDQSSGRSHFNGLYVTLRKRQVNRLSFDISYTLSRVLNNTDDINFRPVDSRAPDAEWGPSLNDRLHVLAVNAVVRGPLGLDVVPVLFLSSGQPLNPLTGLDNNGDTIFNDRPAGYARNSDRTTGYKQLDLGVLRTFPVGGGAIEVRAEIFNLFNAVNYSGFFNYGASGVRPDEKGTLAFQPTVAGPARQFQFQVRYRF
jgi:hypothetical protein